MHELLMAHGTVRSERDDWMDDNTRGLSLAAAAEWDEATEAFAAAADVLARRAPDDSSHDALALILGNLAQACFRAGRTDDAFQHAQRACALRAAIAGEDAMPVARARMDLAVILGASGRLDEARALIQRAIAAAERHVGDDDVRLVVMLENAARLTLAAGDPASAEPLLLRLHALLGAHGMSTHRADRLIGKVDSLRTRIDTAQDTADRAAAAESAAAESALAAARSHAERAAGVDLAVYAHASIAEQEAQAGWDDDQPLRDAVALTDVLLRTTPSGVIAIQPPVNHDDEILAAFETVVDTPVEPMMDVIDERPTPAVPLPPDLLDEFDFPVQLDEEQPKVFGIVVEHGFGNSALEPAAPDAGAGLTEPSPGDLTLDDAVASDAVASDAVAASAADVPTPRQSLDSVDTAPPQLERVPPARDLADTPDTQNAAEAEAAIAPRATRAGRTIRATRPNPVVKKERSNRAGLIGSAIVAAVAAGVAVWYFLLR